MDFVISLAHFCEVHGPTSILCTQINPIDCATCIPCPIPPSEDVSKGSNVLPGFFEPPAVEDILNLAAPLLSPFDSPPASPRSSTSSFNPYFPDHRAAHSSRTTRSSIRGFSFTSDTDGDSCDNCMFLVPKSTSDQLPDGAPGSPTKDGRGRHGSPVLRTTQAVIARGAPADTCESLSEKYQRSQATTPHEDEVPQSMTAASTPSSNSDSTTSSTYHSAKCHTHLLTYVSTKQPISQSSYSVLRRACIRTLSNETLPKGSPSGPLYFGDPHAGYTIAYVFRVPDPRARGRRRVYALMALGGRDSWRVSKVMVMITKVFESIASQIIAQAERMLEQESLHNNNLSMSVLSSGAVTPPLSSSLPSPNLPKDPHSPIKERSQSATTSPVTQGRQLNDVSSFLSAKRVDTHGYPRVSREVMRAKGLAEIVGKDNFFVELHAKFCVVLSTLVKEFTL